MKVFESSLSRLFSKMQEHDTGTITAFRGEYTKKENRARNRELLSDLVVMGYRVTEVDGSYIENFNTPQANEVKEDSFFVEDWADKGRLRADLEKLGQKYEQDSVLFIPKINSQGTTKAILIGTRADAWPGLGKETPFFKSGWGRPAEFMTKVRNRPFIFESVIRQYPVATTRNGKWAARTLLRNEARALREE